MQPKFRRSAVAALLAPALALPAAALHARQDMRNWDESRLYRNTWSAEEMIDTEVRGANGEQIGDVKDIIVGSDGNISKVVVEVGGFFEIGDQHIGVPWKDVQIGADMQWVQVPLREVENGTYSLYGRVPQGEDVTAAQGAWRVNELVGDYASLRDVPRYGLVTDVIFNDQGKATGVIVDRGAGTWGGAGWYGYPYAGYYPGAYAYPLPYRRTEVADIERFDYFELAQQSQYAGERSAQRQQQAQARQGKRSQQDEGAAAGSSRTGAAKKPTKDAVSALISGWPETSRFAAQKTMQKYGPPAEATPTHLVWFDNGPWKRTIITNQPANHDFPMPHQDVMEQVIDYQVPPDKVDELAAYDGSVYVDRTRGEISARCDLEPANFIALNLAHDIINGKRSVEQARKQYAELVVAHMTDQQPVAYAENLAFQPPKKAGFSDEPIIAQDTIQKLQEMKQAMMQKELSGAAAGGSAPQAQPKSSR